MFVTIFNWAIPGVVVEITMELFRGMVKGALNSSWVVLFEVNFFIGVRSKWNISSGVKTDFFRGIL